MAYAATPIAIRLATKRIILPNGCHIWTASLNSMGYGRIRNEFGRNELAHRVAWRLSGRPLLPGLELDHVVCRSPKCINPEHLEQVTHAENVARGNTPSAIAHRNGTCLKGHAQIPENGIFDKRGKWRCNACRRARRAESKGGVNSGA